MSDLTKVAFDASLTLDSIDHKVFKGAWDHVPDGLYLSFVMERLLSSRKLVGKVYLSVCGGSNCPDVVRYLSGLPMLTSRSSNALNFPLEGVSIIAHSKPRYCRHAVRRLHSAGCTVFSNMLSNVDATI